MTSGGKLHAKNIIHAVGPFFGRERGKENTLLRDAILASLFKAEELRCETISLPAISTGVFGFPKEECAKLMFECI